MLTALLLATFESMRASGQLCEVLSFKQRDQLFGAAKLDK